MALLASSVILHKVPMAYSVGLIFYIQNQPLMKISTLGFFISFVLSTPVGLIIGASINIDGGLTVIIIQSIAGGAFIYTALFDFVVNEFHDSDDIQKEDPRDYKEKKKTHM